MEKDKQAQKIEDKKSQMESKFDVRDVIVIDNGADSIKIGFSGEDKPRAIIQTVIGIPEEKEEDANIKVHTQFRNSLFGDQIIQARKDNKYKSIEEKYPIQFGKIQDDNSDKENNNFTRMRELWQYALENILQVNEIQNYSTFNSKEYKQQIAAQLFDDMKVNSVLFMNSASLSLFSTGTTTGLVCELGHSQNQIVPIFEGYPIAHTQQQSFVSGEEISNKLNTIFKEYGLDLDQQTIKEIKQKMCHVAQNYDYDVQGPNIFTEEEQSYELPDGQVIKINNDQRYTPSEVLFQPDIASTEGKDFSNLMSIPEMMVDALKRCDEELEKEMLQNIVLCGGSSLFKGFQSRVERELIDLLGNQNISRKDINFNSTLHQRLSSWIGGSMLGSLSTFQELAIKKNEYEENHELKWGIIHKKTF